MSFNFITADTHGQSRLSRHLMTASLDVAAVNFVAEMVISIINILRDKKVLTDAQLHDLTRTPTMRLLSGKADPRKSRHDPYATLYRPEFSAPTPAPARTGYWKRHWSKW